jgi:GNAT superfamily N-acetyltransferase
MAVREIGPGETRLAFEAMRALRTALGDEDEFVRRVDELQRPEGYRLVGSFDDGIENAAAVAGFRLGHMLAWGRYIYVDDLSTSPDVRRRGHARALLDWLLEEGRRSGCDQIHLDSATRLERADAHRLYMNAGYVISALHFQRAVPG